MNEAPFGICDTLAEAGHRVVFLEPLFLDEVSARGPTHPGVEKIEIPAPESVRKYVALLRFAALEHLKGFYADPDFLSKIRGYHFDLAVSQPMEASGYALFYKLGLEKFVTVFSANPGATYPVIFGAHSAVSWVPTMLSRGIEKMGFRERALNWYYTLLERPVFDSYEGFDEFMYAQEPAYPGSKELMLRSSYLLLNSEPLLDFPKPLHAKIVYIGGIAVPKSVEPLSEEFDRILGERKHSVFISFGSMAKSADMPMASRNGLVVAMKRLPDVTFIWKYENLSDPLVKELPQNVYPVAWAPQLALLADKRLSAFVSHAGAGSQQEVAASGRKVLCIPIFADQFANCQQLARVGAAQIFDKNDLKDDKKLVKAFKELLDNDDLSKNAEQLAEMIAEKPFTASETFVRHVEFAAKYGPLPQLDPYGRQLSFSQYYLLDVIGILVFALILTIFITWKILRCIFGAIFRKQKVE
ncbi:unnamed protein product, partial [Mesorhabditis spiculigera]